MTEPVAPAKFVHPDDIAARFEGTIPDGQLQTNPPGRVQLLIGDVEATLIGLVPSLDVATITDIGEARVRRVEALVCSKVLELYRNPGGSSSESKTVDDVTTARSYWRDSDRGRISFTADELNGVRLRTRRSRFGTIPVAPWRPTC
jgi:hypothetical protein